MKGMLGVSVNFPVKGAARMPVSRDGNQWCFAFLPLSCHELSDAPPWEVVLLEEVEKEIGLAAHVITFLVSFLPFS